MAQDLIETWQSVALEDPEYGKRRSYFSILTVLVELKNTSSSSLELNLRGNHPLFEKNRLTDPDLDVLCRSLQLHPRLVHVLDLSYNSLTDASMTSLSNYLKVPECALQALNLTLTDVKADGIALLSNALHFNTSVVDLDLSGVELGHHGGIAIASMLQINTSLKHLGLKGADLDTDCIIAMATVLQGNRALRKLDLSRPLLHSHLEESTIHISKALKVNFSLRELCLRKHDMTDTGMEWVCRALCENHTLTHLDVSCNKLSRDGARHCAMLLGNNSTLQHIDLSHNRIQDEGLVWISTALSTTNNILSRLNVCSNDVEDEGLCALAKALKINNSLQKIYIWGNEIGESTCQAFYHLLESGRLSTDDIDVKPYEVDGVRCLAKIT